MDKEDFIYDLKYFNNIVDATDYLNEYHIHKDDIIDLQYHPNVMCYVLVTWNEEKWQKWKEKSAEPHKKRDREPNMSACHYIGLTKECDDEFTYNTEIYMYKDIRFYYRTDTQRYDIYYVDGKNVYETIEDVCKFIENNMDKFVVED